MRGEGEAGGDGDGSPGWVGRPGGSLGWWEAKIVVFLMTVMMVIVTLRIACLRGAQKRALGDV